MTTSVLGGGSTIIASYLTRVRNSNEPETSNAQVCNLSKFVRECYAFVEDHEHDTGQEYDARMNELWNRMEEVLGGGNISTSVNANGPGGGIGNANGNGNGNGNRRVRLRVYTPFIIICWDARLGGGKSTTLQRGHQIRSRGCARQTFCDFLPATPPRPRFPLVSLCTPAFCPPDDAHVSPLLQAGLACKAPFLRLIFLPPDRLCLCGCAHGQLLPLRVLCQRSASFGICKFAHPITRLCDIRANIRPNIEMCGIRAPS